MRKKSDRQRTILPRAFFDQPTLLVARELLGKFLVRKHGAGEQAYMICETEAYDGPDDRASHASRGRTPRNAVMFGDAGVFYVYFIYGMHCMLNVVTGPHDYPAAVLIRGVVEWSGPGRLTKALAVTRSFDGTRCEQKSGLWIEDRGVVISDSDIIRAPRIGVAYAGKTWARKPYRFLIVKTKNI